MSPLVAATVLTLGLALSAFLAALQMSLRSASRGTLEVMADRRDSPALKARATAIAEDTPAHAAAVAFPRTIASLAAAIAAVYVVVTIRSLEAPDLLSVGIGVAGAAILLWIFAVVIPQSVAEHAPERTVLTWSQVIRAHYVALTPLRGAVNVLDEIVRRLAGDDGVAEDDALEAGLRSVVEEGEREGVIDDEAREMIEAVVEFSQTTVEQIMTPRTEVTALERTDDLDEVMRFLATAGHSRVPIYDDNLDHIEGLLYAKDLLHWLASDDAGDEPKQTFSIKSIVRPATFVPETKTIRELLAELLANRVHVAMVADEYGGTSGLVTIEDIVEEIFGEIRDEYEAEEDDDDSVDIDADQRTAILDARTEIDDANDRLEDIRVELPESDDYDTVGGYVTVTLGHIPEPNETIRTDTFLLTVLEAEPTRVTKVRIEHKPEHAEDEDAESETETNAAD